MVKSKKVIKNKATKRAKSTRKVRMDGNDNKIDLSSVNKKSKKETIASGGGLLKGLFKKKDAYKRDNEGKFTAGSGGLKKLNKSFNIKRALPLVAIIALVGGYLVYDSFAAGSRATVTSWYRVCMNREPDAGGLDYWSGRLDKGEHSWAVADAFLKAGGKTQADCVHADVNKNAPAANNTTPKPQTPAQPAPSAGVNTGSDTRARVVLAYKECENRSGDESGIAFWVSEINSGKRSVQKMREHMAGEDKKRGGPGDCSYGKAMNAKAECGSLHQCRLRVESQISGTLGQPVVIHPKTKQIIYSRKNDAEVQKLIDFLADKMLNENWSAWVDVRNYILTTPQYQARQARKKEVSDFFYNLYMSERAAKGVSGYPVNNMGLPLRPDYCEHAVNNWASGKSDHFNPSPACLEPVGLASYPGAFLAYVNKQVTLAEIEAVMRSGSQGTLRVLPCEGELGSALPECGGGAKSFDLDAVEEKLEKERAQKNKAAKSSQSSSSPSTQQPTNSAGPSSESKQAPTPSTSNSSRGGQETTTKQQQATSQQQPTPRSRQDAATQAAIERSPILAYATQVVPVNAPLPVSQPSDRRVARTQKVLSVVSEVEASMVDSILFSRCYDLERDFKIGDDGDCVSKIQEYLAISGSPTLSVTGHYDDMTESAVMQFQTSRKVQDDVPGVVGERTWELLNKAAAPSIHRSPFAPARGSLVNNR